MVIVEDARLPAWLINWHGVWFERCYDHSSTDASGKIDINDGSNAVYSRQADREKWLLAEVARR